MPHSPSEDLPARGANAQARLAAIRADQAGIVSELAQVSPYYHAFSVVNAVSGHAIRRMIMHWHRAPVQVNAMGACVTHTIHGCAESTWGSARPARNRARL